MNTTSRFIAAISLGLLALTLSGCVTHRLLISFTGEGEARASYTVEGDSLDVFDERIPLPKSPWRLLERDIEVDSSGNLKAKLLFDAIELDSIEHPLAPVGEHGMIEVSQKNHWLFSTQEVRVTFPSWRAFERYGDPDDYLPDDIEEIQDSGLDSLLSPEAEEEVQRIEARAQQLWTVNRYLRQVERLVVATVGDDADTSIVREAVSRFAPVIRAHVMSLQGDPLEPVDPRDISLEWYPELRESMILSASEATGLAYEPLSVALDSLEAEYKRWLDLGDDGIEVMIVVPKSHWRNVTPEPEEAHGDTLAWSIDQEMLANADFDITTIGYHVAMLPIILVGLFVGIVAGFIVRLGRRHS